MPRDISGSQLASLLLKYGYEVTRQTGSHLRLTSHHMGQAHHITVPRHASLKVGTLSSILADVARYLEMDRDLFMHEIFGR